MPFTFYIVGAAYLPLMRATFLWPGWTMCPLHHFLPISSGVTSLRATPSALRWHNFTEGLKSVRWGRQIFAANAPITTSRHASYSSRFYLLHFTLEGILRGLRISTSRSVRWTATTETCVARSYRQRLRNSMAFCHEEENGTLRRLSF